jgi:hypothetical protein
MHTHQHQGVTIRRGFGYKAGADIAAGPAAIVNNNRVAPRFRELLPDDARHQITRPAGSKRHNHADRFGGVRVRKSRRTGQQGRCRQ